MIARSPDGMKPMKYNSLVFIVTIFFTLRVQEMAAQTQQIKFKHLGLENGLSHPAVLSGWAPAPGLTASTDTP
jgi:hypothetical protein